MHAPPNGRAAFAGGVHASYNPYGGQETGPSATRPHIDPRSARRKSMDYSARRAGGARDENASRHNMTPRRSDASRNGAPPNLNGSQPHASHSGNNDGNGRVRHSGSPPIDPRVARRRSASYAARRSGSGQEAEERRSFTSSTPPPRTSPPSPTSHQDRRTSPPIDPRVARRRSVDYAARRSGRSSGSGERRRSGTTFAASTPSASPAGSSSSDSDSDVRANSSGKAQMDPRVARRRSVDYSSRRSGRGDENVTRYSATRAPSAPAPASPPPLAASGGAVMDPRVQRRRSVDYAARRSGNSRSNDAQPSRRGQDASSTSSSRASTRDRSAPPAQADASGSGFSLDASRLPRPAMDPRVVRRRSVDYSARRSGSQRARVLSTSQSRGGQDSGSASGGERRLERQVPIRRKEPPSYEARRSGDHTRQRRLRQEYTLAQVKSALSMQPDSTMPERRRCGVDEENRRRGLTNGATPFGSALDSAHIDHAAVALKSVDRLMSTVCDLANVSMHDLQSRAPQTPPQNGSSGERMDPAQGALLSLRKMADSVKELQFRG